MNVWQQSANFSNCSVVQRGVSRRDFALLPLLKVVRKLTGPPRRPPLLRQQSQKGTSFPAGNRISGCRDNVVTAFVRRPRESGSYRLHIPRGLDARMHASAPAADSGADTRRTGQPCLRHPSGARPYSRLSLADRYDPL